MTDAELINQAIERAEAKIGDLSIQERAVAYPRPDDRHDRRKFASGSTRAGCPETKWKRGMSLRTDGGRMAKTVDHRCLLRAPHFRRWLCAIAIEHNINAPILGATFGRIVRRNRIAFAEAFGIQ